MENILQIVPVFPLLINNVTSYRVPGLTNHREFILLHSERSLKTSERAATLTYHFQINVRAECVV